MGSPILGLPQIFKLCLLLHISGYCRLILHLLSVIREYSQYHLYKRRSGRQENLPLWIISGEAVWPTCWLLFDQVSLSSSCKICRKWAPSCLETSNTPSHVPFNELFPKKCLTLYPLKLKKKSIFVFFLFFLSFLLSLWRFFISATIACSYPSYNPNFWGDTH